MISCYPAVDDLSAKIVQNKKDISNAIDKVVQFKFSISLPYSFCITHILLLFKLDIRVQTLCFSVYHRWV